MMLEHSNMHTLVCMQLVHKWQGTLLFYVVVDTGQ